MRSFSKPKKLPGRLHYYVRVYDQGSGRRTWLSTGCDDLKSARAWLDTQRMNEALGPERVAAQESADMTFKDACEAWLATKDGNVSSQRYRNYKGVADAFWLPHFGRKALRDVSTDDVQEYFRKRRTGVLPRAKRRPSASTVNTDLMALRSLLAYCLQRGWLARNPATPVERAPGEIRRTIRALTAEQEEALVRACREGEVIEVSARRGIGGRKGGKVSKEKVTFKQTVPMPPYLAPLVRLAAGCGFRKRTLLSLEWGHIDFEKKEWRIPAALMKVPEEYTAPCPEVVLGELRAYRQRLLEKEGPRRVAADARIFGLESEASIRKSFRRAARKAGLPKLSVHDLRRSYVNKLRRAGIGLEVAMRLSAHRNISTLVKFYREVDESELRAAVAALDGSPAPAKKAGEV